MLTISVLLLIGFTVWLLHEPAKKPPREKSPHGDKFQNRCAVHETGHALSAWCCTLVDSIESVTIERSDGGRVSYLHNSHVTPEDIWCSLVIILSGVAAEIIEYGVIRSAESESDLQKSLDFAKDLATRGSVKSPWGTKSREKTLIEAHGTEFHKIISVLLSKKTIGQSDLEKVLGSRSFINIVRSPISLGIFKSGFVIPR